MAIQSGQSQTETDASRSRRRDTPSFKAIQERADHLESQDLHDPDKTCNINIADYFLELNQKTVLEYQDQILDNDDEDLSALSFDFLLNSYQASLVCGSVFLSVLQTQRNSFKMSEALRDLKLPPPGDEAQLEYEHGCSNMHTQRIDFLFDQDLFPDSLKKALDEVYDICKAAREGEVKDKKDALCKRKRVRTKKRLQGLRYRFRFGHDHSSNGAEKKEHVLDRIFKIRALEKEKEHLDMLTSEYFALEGQLQILRAESYGLHQHIRSNNSFVRRIRDSTHDIVLMQEVTEQLSRTQKDFNETCLGIKDEVLFFFKLINCARCLVWRKLASDLGFPTNGLCVQFLNTEQADHPLQPGQGCCSDVIQ